MRKLCRSPGCDELALPGLAHCAEHEALRQRRLAERRQAAKVGQEAQAGGEFYRTARWRKARAVFLDRHPLCEDCASLGLVVAATEVDHWTPHRGDPVLMWNRSNWQALCKPCHSRKTAREVWHGGRLPKGE
ncbi:HNH endonuclease signature motif containing protein [Paenirhodobacter enshiensis]|uniref:Putative HNH nuclease YajD n=1 Tax=Paenirhodobacter enshiensis TaxID=1105367 RepID=A0A086XQN8_9RHOB|nr:HNH endonuclease signature motif containing protein [Paenirhodobacter enshiensis]KFI24338.1 HNH endonuclease [Paenirhodobacter enshiensis]